MIQSYRETFSFTLTQGDGSKIYGYCRRFLYDGWAKCFCILSKVYETKIIINQILKYFFSQKNIKLSKNHFKAFIWIIHVNIKCIGKYLEKRWSISRGSTISHRIEIQVSAKSRSIFGGFCSNSTVCFSTLSII